MNSVPVRPSVIICAYTLKRLQDIREAVGSMLAQSRSPHEVILSVDHNRELLERLRQEMPSAVSLVLNEGEQGLSETRNVGIRAATGDILAFMDDDAVADPDWLENLVEPFSDSSVVAVGGMTTPQWVNGGRPRWFPEDLDWVVACTYRGMAVSKQNETRNVIGCNMAFRRSVLEKVGWFNSGLGRIGKTKGQAEETELCLRIRREIPGARILYQQSAIVHHSVPSERLTLQFLLKRSYNEGFYKARMQQYSPRAEHVLSAETAYLHHLLFRFVPQHLLRFYQPDNITKLIAVLICISAVGMGSLVARITPEH